MAQLERQRHGEGAPAALDRVGADAPAVQPDELVGERQADARALVRASGGAADAMEALEERGDPPRGRRPRCRGWRARRGRPRGPGDADAPVRRVLQGVGEQVEDDLLPHLGIDVDRARQRRAVDVEGQAGALDRRREGVDDLGRQRGEVGRCAVGSAGARPRCARSPACVDEPVQSPRVAAHDAERSRSASVASWSGERSSAGPRSASAACGTRG